MNGLLKKIHIWSWRKNRQHQLKSYIELACDFLNAAQSPMTIVELGCGYGNEIEELKSKYHEHHFIGLDIVEVKDRSFEFHRADLNNDFPLCDELADVIICNQVIEHIIFTDKFIIETQRVLKKGGVAIFSTVNLAAWHYRLMLLFGYSPLVLHPSRHLVGSILRNSFKEPFYGHKSVFTYNGLVQLCKIYDFEIIIAFGQSMSFVLNLFSKLILSIFPNLGTYIFIAFIKR